MEKIKYYIEKYKVLCILIVVILFLLLCLIFSLKGKSSKKIEKLDDLTIENKENLEQEKVKKEEKIKVDIKGFVETPGVYEMDTDSRVIDVINKAGGLKENSNTEYINLSKKLVDEMIIIIYSNTEVEKYKETDKDIIYIEYECICPDNKNDACITDKDTVNTNGIKNKNENKTNSNNIESNGKISINTATLEELTSLDGIGESKAKSIIDYREQNGEFKKLEDLMNVSGIGEKAYSKIKDNIKL